ncbi:MAG: 4-alpha-glucanotransferase [Chitinophagaceae bacterium]|nr:4-alpha-glucanotransferase [Chitinophagaceae bacterium]
MILHFYLRYSTKFGQTLHVSGNIPTLGDGDYTKAFALTYLNDQLWHGSIEVAEKEFTQPICYKYLLQPAVGEMIAEFGDDRIVDLGSINASRIVLYDFWNFAGEFENAFFTSPFTDVLLKRKAEKKLPAKKTVKPATHEFNIKAPLLKEDEVICLSGSSAVLNDWDKENVLLLTKCDTWWTIRVNLANIVFPVMYKYGIYNITDKKFVRFEEGSNRILLNEDGKDVFTVVHDGFAKLNNVNWKAAGVAIPVFSLRSNKSFGTGEFTDLKLLINWAKNTGIKMIQLLPVNDTTATFTWKDSYPYSAISAFALHPMLINLETVAGTAHVSVVKALSAKQKQLNKLPKLDYEEVMKVKLAAIRELYQLQKNSFRDDLSFMSFFELNRHWLEPYAAFSYLRDKYKTADFNTWKTNAVFHESEIQQLVSPLEKHYDEIALHYFTQYHLHLQLKTATDYAHRNGVVIKGDIPIGICRNSADAWVEPDLYHMNEQAGAPPDAFTAKGQNWGFPTYNWDAMQQDNFTWWRKRFDQMSNYFDAFRIDHILGFFRIWSIPAHAVEGILGRFVPAIPVSINELFAKKISFERSRYTEPYITDSILIEIFADRKDAVKKHFFNGYKLKEKFKTQRQVETFFKTDTVFDNKVKQGLYDLIANVIFFEVENSSGQEFHFRISMEETFSFKNLDSHSQKELRALYIDYFYHRQEDLWKKEAMKKLPGLKSNTNMLVCGEDLGMVPQCVPEVMEQLGILSLEIQRMPKKTGFEFFHPKDAPYLSVVSPSTHDMSTVRGWWEEDNFKIKHFYKQLMGQEGEPPVYCEPWINKEIILQHLYSPAMWSIFQLQDLMGMDGEIRREDPNEERINNPAEAEHYWNYRMHICLEDLLKEDSFNAELKSYIEKSGR